MNKNSPILTKAQGEELLRRDLAMTEKALHALMGPGLNPNHFSATVSLVFNMGSGNFKASQIRSRLLRDDHDRPPTFGGNGVEVGLLVGSCQV